MRGRRLEGLLVGGLSRRKLDAGEKRRRQETLSAAESWALRCRTLADLFLAWTHLALRIEAQSGVELGHSSWSEPIDVCRLFAVALQWKRGY